MEDGAAPYKGFEKDLAKHAARSESGAMAQAAGLPGPLREAFAGVPPRDLYGFKLQPVTAGLEAVLTAVDSPLLPSFGIILSMRGKPEKEVKAALARKIKPKPECFIETVFCFVKPARELRALLDKGRVAFREAAMAELGDKLNPLQVSLLYQAASEHYAQAFITAISYEAAPQEGGGFPSPPAETPTGSAGG